MTDGARGRLEHIVREYTITLSLDCDHFRALRRMVESAERAERGSHGYSRDSCFRGAELEVYNEIQRLSLLTKPYGDKKE